MACSRDEREAQIRRLLPLVRTIARRIRRLVANVDFDDLIGDGSIGLIRAVDNFDPSRGPSLENYARHLIVGAMLNGIRRMDHVSERVRRSIRDGENERYRLAVECGALPTLEEVEQRSPGFTRAMIAVHRTQPLSLDAPLPEGERVRRDWRNDPAVIVDAREQTRRIDRAIAQLPDRQRDVIRAHYYGGRSLREISTHLAISPQRTSQLHVSAVSRLRKALHAATH